MVESGKKGLRERIRRLFAKGPPDPDGVSIKKSLEQRDFDRYQVAFPIMVSGADPGNQAFEEKSLLQDVSGSGARFISAFPGRYYPGQLLQISILLDASDDVRACIHNEASVVRIHPPEPEDIEVSSQTQRIAIKFHSAFDFERLDSARNGYRG